MNRKIFIDCGAHSGISVDLFRKHWKDHSEYEIYSFEANPILEKQLSERNVHHSMKAVWIYDGDVDFYVGSSFSSSLIKEKRTGGLDTKNPLKVPCIDLSKWIVDNFDKNDYIILKMDIEGAEYKVVDKMITDLSIDYIDKFYIEWHWYKVGVEKNVHDRIINTLLHTHNLPTIDWDGEKGTIG